MWSLRSLVTCDLRVTARSRFTLLTASPLAAALTPLPPAAHLPHCAHVYVRISNCSRKAKRADVIRPSADEVCSRNSTEINYRKIGPRPLRFPGHSKLLREISPSSLASQWL